MKTLLLALVLSMLASTAQARPKARGPKFTDTTDVFGAPRKLGRLGDCKLRFFNKEPLIEQPVAMTVFELLYADKRFPGCARSERPDDMNYFSQGQQILRIDLRGSRESLRLDDPEQVAFLQWVADKIAASVPKLGLRVSFAYVPEGTATVSEVVASR